MTFSDVITSISNQGFAPLNQGIQNITVYAKQTAEQLELCFIINHTNQTFYSPEKIEKIRRNLENRFFLQGIPRIHSFYMIYTDNPAQNKCFIEQSCEFWIIDTVGKRMIIYDNQPGDYYHLKSVLEEQLTSPPSIRKFQSIPFMTILLFSINILVFLFMNVSDSVSVLQQGGCYWKYIYEDHQYYRLFTSMFLHFDGEHILNNMISLALIGSTTEAMLGHSRFLLVYLGSGLGGNIVSSLFHMLYDGNTITLSAGASGAVFGILGALIIAVLLNQDNRQHMNPANITLIAILSILNGFTGSSIDNYAHIGGFIFGMLLTFLCCLRSKNVLK